MFRRKFIKATGATMLGGALAGCSGNAGGSTETQTGTGTATQTGTGTASGDFGDLDSEILDDDPAALQVSSRELYQQNGEVGLRGTVENTGDAVYESVEVEVTLQDDQGEVLYEFIDETEEETTQSLQPDSEWQFDVVFEEAQMNEVSKYTVELDGDRAQTTADEGTADEEFDVDSEVLDDDPPGLQVSGQSLYQQNGEVGLRGTVENTGDVPYESVQVEVTLQDDQGEVLWEFIDETEQEATRTLEPGAEWQFDVVFEEAQMNEVSKYTVELDGDRAQSTGDEAVGNETTGSGSN